MSLYLYAGWEVRGLHPEVQIQVGVLICVRRCSTPEPCYEFHLVAQVGTLRARETTFGLLERQRQRGGRGEKGGRGVEVEGMGEGEGWDGGIGRGEGGGGEAEQVEAESLGGVREGRSRRMMGRK